MKEISLRYSEPLLRQAVRSFFFRSVYRQLGLSFFVIVAAMTAVLAYLVWSDDRTWFVGFLGAAVLFVGVFLVAIYVAHLRNTIGRYRQMRTPEATFAYDEQQITLSSELGSATMPWSAITEVWRYSQFWLILFSKSQFATFPLDGLDEDARAFIIRKTSEPNA